MNLLNKLTLGLTSFALMASALAFAFTGTASADCYQYNQNGFTTSSTPVFNNICGVPEGINNESDFVRIRQSSNGNDEDNTNNPAYTVGTLTSSCAPGTKYDLWNYLHNDASSNDNPDTGSGSAVATGVSEDLTAPINTTNDSFTFGDTITSTNAANSGIHDSATLDCNGQQVQLSLVTGSVHIYSDPYGTTWANLPDGTLNNPLAVGSTSAGASSEGSGSEWGCWTYRIVIVYQVEVTAVPTPPKVTPPVCNLLTVVADNENVKLEGLKYTSNGATVTGASINFGNGTTETLTPAQISALSATSPYTFSYSKAGTYNVTATINTSNGNVTSASCVGSITTSTPTTPPTTPPSTPPTTPPTVVTTTPTSLANTGPGSVIAIFAVATAIGAGAYRWFLGRRLQRS
jgi:hypothetical protein